MKVLSVVGARPQFVKAATVSRALAEAGVEEFLVHTGQHYDENMCRVFFDDLGIRRPDVDLEVGSGSHAYQTGESMQRLEPVCAEQEPDAVLVYGDTNATLAGALVGAKLNVDIAHVEAGLRSFDRTMPEEVNRVLTDHMSSRLFCPTQTAVDNLVEEGIRDGVHNVGDVMYDAALHFARMAATRRDVLGGCGLQNSAYALVTIHRDFNTDHFDRLEQIVHGLLAVDLPVVFPVHPRARKRLESFELWQQLEDGDNVTLLDPVGYLDMVRLEAGARVIVTDSGGVQKEACFHGVPCVTVRPSTEWVETVASGWNRLVEADAGELAQAVAGAEPPRAERATFYVDGHSAEAIATILVEGM